MFSRLIFEILLKLFVALVPLQFRALGYIPKCKNANIVAHEFEFDILHKAIPGTNAVNVPSPIGQLWILGIDALFKQLGIAQAIKASFFDF